MKTVGTFLTVALFMLGCVMNSCATMNQDEVLRVYSWLFVITACIVGLVTLTLSKK